MRGIAFIAMLGLLFQGAGQTTDFTPTLSTDPIFDTSIPSPEAGAMGRFVESPMSLYYGAASVEVPIYTISLKNLEIPVSLSYNSSGIKVDDQASAVGLGWTLNAGGTITGSVHGLHDFSHVVEYPADISTFTGGTSFSDPDYTYALEASEADLNAEPDLYMYQFLGRSGKFVKTQAGSYVTIPGSKMIIEVNGGFELTDESGTRYLFKAEELTNNEQFPAKKAGVNSKPIANSTYYLTEVSTPYGEVVVFEYETYSYDYDASRFEEYFARKLQPSGCGSKALENRSGVNQSEVFTGKRLTTITTTALGGAQGVVLTFNYNATVREDVASSKVGAVNEAKALSSIVVSYDDQDIKTYTLTHDYFRCVGYQAVGGNAYDNALASRLKLVSIKETGKDPHEFEYYESVAGGMPPRLSYAQDEYGYYNGVTGNTTGFPQGTIGDYDLGQIANVSTLANREVNTSTTKVFSLKKHTLPTGGHTEFVYESKSHQEDYIITTQTLNNIFSWQGTNASANETISVPATYVDDVRFLVTIFPVAQGGGGGGPLEFVDVTLSGNGVNETYSVLGSTEEEFISDGSYSLAIANTTNGDYEVTVNVTGVIESTSTEQRDVSDGGIRVSSIRHYDEDNTLQLTSNFDYEGPSSNWIPQYRRDFSEYPDGTTQCDYRQYTSAGIPLLSGLADQKDVGYSKVTRTDVSASSPDQVIIYEFHHNLSEISGQPHYGLPASYSWARGLPKATTYRVYEGGTPKDLKKEETTYYVSPEVQSLYAFEDDPNTLDTGREFHIPGFRITQLVPQRPSQIAEFEIEFYKLVSLWYHPQSTITTAYDYAGDSIVEQVTSHYDPDYRQLSQVDYVNSNGETYTRKYRKPYDYDTTRQSLEVYKGMWDRNMLNVDVEELVEHQPSGTIISSKVTTFQEEGGYYLPHQQYILNTEEGLPLAADDTFADEPVWESTKHLLKNTYSFDDNALLVAQKVNDQETKVIWGYDNNQMTAVIANNDGYDAAYTSFEDYQFGGWTVSNTNPVAACASSFETAKAAANSLDELHQAQEDYMNCQNSATPPAFSSDGKTGKRSLSENMTKTISRGGDYVVTLWAKGTSPVTVNGSSQTPSATEWELLTWNLTVTTGNTVTVSPGSSQIDEVRLHHKDAYMTSYSYEIGRGVSYKNDENNNITTYEYQYDWLDKVKDKDGNIMQTYDYNYSNN